MNLRYEILMIIDVYMLHIFFKKKCCYCVTSFTTELLQEIDIIYKLFEFCGYIISAHVIDGIASLIAYSNVTHLSCYYPILFPLHINLNLFMCLSETSAWWTTFLPAECFPGRTDVQCLHRWQKVLNPELVKGPWSKEVSSTVFHFEFVSLFLK